MRIDAHQHFWHYDPEQYEWMTDKMQVLQRDRLPTSLEPLLRAIGFDGSITVQARQMVEETEWLLELSDLHDLIKGVVGWVDLRSDRLRQQLERYALHPKLVGVRHVVQDEPDDHFMLRDDFRRGIAALAEFGLTYDLLLFPRHLPVAVELARKFPEQPFVLDHIAKPNIAERSLSPWREDLQALASIQTVYCKLSGMVTETRWGQWKAEDFHPYLDVVFEAFGAERVMIGSDWPVCKLSGKFEDVMKIVIEYVDRLPPAEREAVLGGNCARFYGVEGNQV